MERDITLTFDQASDVLAALEAAADEAQAHGQFALQMEVEDAIGILVDKMFPGLPKADG